MVIISKEFNEELGEYLSKIHKVKSHSEGTKISLFDRLFASRSNKPVEIVDDSITAEEAEELDELEEEIKETEDTEELYKAREGLLQRFLKSMRRDRSGYEDDALEAEDEFEQMDEDVKDVLKITFHWINQLPPKQLKAFAASEDFNRYKDILNRYGLIKPKGLEQEDKAVNHGD